MKKSLTAISLTALGGLCIALWCLCFTQIKIDNTIRTSGTIVRTSAYKRVSEETITGARNGVNTILNFNSTKAVRIKLTQAYNSLLLAELNNQLRQSVSKIDNFKSRPKSVLNYTRTINQWQYLKQVQKAKLQMPMSLHQMIIQRESLIRLRSIFSDRDYLQRARRVTLADWQAAKHSVKDIRSAKFLHFYNQRLASARAWINTETSPSRS